MTNKQFRILTIDGGGIKGLYSMYILDFFETKYCLPNGKLLADCFDLICGCSIGALIATCIILRVPMSSVIKEFTSSVKSIFPLHDDWLCCNCINKGFHSVRQLFVAKYSNEELGKIILKYTNTLKMSDLKTNLLVPSYNLTKSQNVVFKNGSIDYEKETVQVNDYKLSDILLATTAAPSYFEPYKIDNDYYIDGGIWANNMSTIGIVEALKYHVGLNKFYSSYSLLSIGNIHADPKNDKKIEFTIHNMPQLINIAIDANADSSIYYSRMLTDSFNATNADKSTINRIAHESDIEYSFDDSSDEFLSLMQELAQQDIKKISNDVFNSFI
jgi:patatin-like phospholipase/acyl hydrolase